MNDSLAEIDVLWITAGLGCDGDTVSITAAQQPSIEDVVMGAIPGLPKVRLHNPVLAYENGEKFLQGAVKKSQELVGLYEQLAKEKNCYFLDLSDVKASSIDGVHYDEVAHQKCAELVYGKIKEIVDAIKNKGVHQDARIE